MPDYKDMTVKDLIVSLLGVDPDWKIEVRDEFDNKINKTKIVAVRDGKTLACLFG